MATFPGPDLPFMALGVLSSGGVIDVTSDVIWDSSDGTVATIQPMVNVAVPQGIGIVTISAELFQPAGNLVGEFELIINP